ncbi:hypothetical protein KM295_10090 [Natronomonas sp. F2-12]|uniref:Sulfotransferase domain-containing protein n=1 Tax=Natronomonas aquatica TaxID=2841590 RepID=A0A9R1CTQ8_9EURY|nr:hypothetical protein [Natronomonas aquatica]MCQ4333825.1 hypothetical protein [Natronomonas aquatica]
MLLHIGYAKAASTWTQGIFAQDGSGFYYLYDDDPGFVNETVVFPNQFQFDADEARTALMDGVNQNKAESQELVIANERLSGHWYTGGYDQKTIADRLSEVLPKAKVLIVIREQGSMLNSVYRQYIKKGGFRSPAEFFLPNESYSEDKRYVSGFNRGPSFSFEMFKYHNIIEYYYKQFGPENVCTIPLEVLKRDAHRYADEIFEFADVTPDRSFDLDTKQANVGIEAFQTPIRRYLNVCRKKDYINDYSPYSTSKTRWIAGSIVRRLELLPTKIKQKLGTRVDEAISEIAAERFAESNQKTNKLVSYNLEDLGYEL